MRSLLPMLSTVTLLAAAANNARADRTIRFPDQSVGTVSIRPASQGGFGYSLFDEGAREGWTRLGPAAGEVVIPDAHVVRLEVTREGGADLTWTQGLPADAIDVLEARGAPIDDAGAGQLSRLVGLKRLELSGTEITSTAAAALAKLIDLQHLSVNSTAMDDEAMPAIAALPHLETAGLYGTGITDTGLRALAESDSLSAVYVGRTRITDAGVAALCELRDLRALNLVAGDPEFRGDRPSPSITDAAVDSLTTRPSLEFLNLSGAELTDSGLERLASSLPDLRGLVIDYTKLTPEGMRALGRFDKLEVLSFHGMTLDDHAARQLSSLTNLRSLSGQTDITDAGVQALATLPKLESLRIDGHGITDASMPYLSRMQALSELTLQHTRVTDRGFAKLTGSESMERIQLTKNRMTTRCVEILATMPKLTRVGLMSIDPRTDGQPVWKGLEDLRSLEEELWLFDCPSLSSEDFSKLRVFTRLKWLRIQGGTSLRRGRPVAAVEGGFEVPIGRPITDADIAHLAHLDRLEFVELASTVVTDEGLASLAGLPNMRRLSISCLATDAGLQQVVQAPSLEYLAIGSPNISDAAIQRVVAGDGRNLSVRRQPFRLDATPVSRSESDSFWRARTAEERTKLNALEGQPPPSLAVTRWLNAADETTLRDFRGKVILIDFWGTWCGPCVKQLPEIRRLHDKYADRGLVVLGLHSTTGAENAADFVASNDLDWPIALDKDDQTKTAYGLLGWPTCYLIDRKGVLRMADIYDGDLEAAIEHLLTETE